jgi:hypothetical protein
MTQCTLKCLDHISYLLPAEALFSLSAHTQTVFSLSDEKGVYLMGPFYVCLLRLNVLN